MNKNMKLDSSRCIPKCDKTNILYERKERNNGKTMISRKHPELQQLFYNHSTLAILDLCDGSTTIEEIAGKITKRYIGVQYEEVLNDTISTIHELWRLGFIVWVDENPFLSIYQEKKGRYTYSILNEEQTAAWMAHNRPCFITPTCVVESTYTETAIKQSSFIFYETFFQIKKNDKEIVTLSLVIPLGKECFFRIGIMDYNVTEEDSEAVNGFLRWICQKHKQFSPLSSNVESVLCYIRPSDNVHIHFLKTYFKAESVGLLQKELQDGSDVEIYQVVIK